MAANGSPRTMRWRRVVWYVLLVVFIGVGGAFAFWRYHGREQRDLVRGQMYLERGNTSQALDQFRAALKVNPKLTQARVGIVRALSKRREFDKALEAVDQAVENGLAPSEAARLKAGVLLDRAGYRFETAGKEFTVKTCEQAIAEDLDPAITLAQHAETAEKPAEAYTLAGDLFSQKLRIEIAEDALLSKAYKQAQDLDKKDELAAMEKGRNALALKMRSNTVLSRQAYEEAIKRDPTAVEPRIRLAQDALVAYYPRTDEAKAVLDPLMKATTPARVALYWMAIAEWYSGDLERCGGAHAAPEQYAGTPARRPREGGGNPHRGRPLAGGSRGGR